MYYYIICTYICISVHKYRQTTQTTKHSTHNTFFPMLELFNLFNILFSVVPIPGPF